MDHRKLLATADAYPTSIRVLAYGPDGFEEHQDCSLEQACKLHGEFPVVWIDVTGLANIPLLELIGARFQLHSLTLEDIVRTHQRAKLEEFKDYLFLVARMAPLPEEENTDQLSLFLGKGFVLSFQERPGDSLDSVRARIRTARGKLRESGPDYLTYAILDATIDAFFPLLEDSGEQLEDLEDDIVGRPRAEVLTSIYNIRRKMLMLRRALWPLREVTAALIREDSTQITAETRIFLRDCYDHTIQIIDLLETYRELSSGLMDVYLSSMSNRLNEIMKVLTMISVVFIPLTFLAGVYGMNFNTDVSKWNMPELNAPYGYVICWAVMLLVAAAEIYYFWRQGWLQSLSTPMETKKRESGEADERPGVGK
ncbi:MAG: magnesium/cobalt transporter CorA [Candidatus Sumerlaeaceae bacterium]